VDKMLIRHTSSLFEKMDETRSFGASLAPSCKESVRTGRRLYS